MAPRPADMNEVWVRCFPSFVLKKHTAVQNKKGYGPHTGCYRVIKQTGRNINISETE